MALLKSCIAQEWFSMQQTAQLIKPQLHGAKMERQNLARLSSLVRRQRSLRATQSSLQNLKDTNTYLHANQQRVNDASITEAKFIVNEKIAARRAPAVALRHSSAQITYAFAISWRSLPADLPQWLFAMALRGSPTSSRYNQVRDSIGPDSDVLEVDHGVLFTKAGLNSMVLPP